MISRSTENIPKAVHQVRKRCTLLLSRSRPADHPFRSPNPRSIADVDLPPTGGHHFIYCHFRALHETKRSCLAGQGRQSKQDHRWWPWLGWQLIHQQILPIFLFLIRSRKSRKSTTNKTSKSKKLRSLIEKLEEVLVPVAKTLGIAPNLVSEAEEIIGLVLVTTGPEEQDSLDEGPPTGRQPTSDSSLQTSLHSSTNSSAMSCSTSWSWDLSATEKEMSFNQNPLPDLLTRSELSVQALSRAIYLATTRQAQRPSFKQKRARSLSFDMRNDASLSKTCDNKRNCRRVTNWSRWPSCGTRGPIASVSKVSVDFLVVWKRLMATSTVILHLPLSRALLYTMANRRAI